MVNIYQQKPLNHVFLLPGNQDLLKIVKLISMTIFAFRTQFLGPSLGSAISFGPLCMCKPLSSQPGVNDLMSPSPPAI